MRGPTTKLHLIAVVVVLMVLVGAIVASQLWTGETAKPNAAARSQDASPTR